jgi:hypothetical protein
MEPHWWLVVTFTELELTGLQFVRFLWQVLKNDALLW